MVFASQPSLAAIGTLCRHHHEAAPALPPKRTALAAALGYLAVVHTIIPLCGIVLCCMWLKAVYWSPCMQTKEGKEAVTLTATEFSDVMGKLATDAEAACRADPSAFPMGHPIYSLDNAKPHKEWQQSQPAERLNVIPANSPDIHKVVEHPLKPFKERWYLEFTLDRTLTTAEDCMARASEILRRTTPTSIRKDMETLPATFESIIKNKGDWADRDLL